jgi:hypothetical protein
MTRWLKPIAIASVVMMVVIQLGVAPASAFVGYGEGKVFGTAGSGDGQFAKPSGVAAEAPVKEMLSSQIGRQVDKTTGLIATGPSKLIQAGSPLSVKLALSGRIADGFEYPQGVAVDNDPNSLEHGDVYVVDLGHNVIDKVSQRVQVLTPTGESVAMFGEVVVGRPKGVVSVFVGSFRGAPLVRGWGG